MHITTLKSVSALTRTEMRHEPLDKIFIDQLTIDGSIGIYDFEREKKQPIVVSVECAYLKPKSGYVSACSESETASTTIVCYKTLSEQIESLVLAKHTDYVEELAERIAELCLLDVRVQTVSVRVTKPKAIQKTQGVGVEIFRLRSDVPHFD